MRCVVVFSVGLPRDFVCELSEEESEKSFQGI